MSALIFLPSNKTRTKSSQETSLPEKIVTVMAFSGINLREEPNVNSKIISTIPYNEKISLVDLDVSPNDKWLKVEYKGLTGFVWRKNIQE